MIYSSGVTILTRSGGSIARHQMKLRTRHLDKMKAYDHTQLLRARELIPTERSRAHLDQRGRDHTFLWERRGANTILTGITLRQYNTLLYELLGTSGKPSTWLPLVEIAELPPSWSSVIFCCLILNFPALALSLLGCACLSWALSAFLGCLWCHTMINHDITWKLYITWAPRS